MQTSEWKRWAIRAAESFVLAGMMTACSLTEKATVQNPGQCALIPPTVCAQLTPGTSAQAGLRYLNPDARWTQYTKMMINPVTFWGGDTQKISAADQQALANYLYQALLQKVGAKFPIVDEPGPGVMRLQFAVLDASSATPVLRTVSMVIPQARALASLKYLATDSYPFVGGVQGEMLATDSVTGKVLGAAIDRRIGGGSLEAAAQWQWGDAENVMDKWAEMTATRLVNLTSGKATS